MKRMQGTRPASPISKLLVPARREIMPVFVLFCNTLTHNFDPRQMKISLLNIYPLSELTRYDRNFLENKREKRNLINILRQKSK